MSNNYDNDKKSRGFQRKPTIHTTISEKAKNLLEKYLTFKDKNGVRIYNSKSEILEHALELLDRYYSPESKEIPDLWVAFREELDMVVVGKTTFLAYISGDYKRAFKENIAVEIIEWYKKKNMVDMSLYEILHAIKDIWTTANYFSKIEIEQGSKGTFQIYFYHNLRSKHYGEFWSKYFTELLCHQKNCKTESFIRNESFILNIKPL